MIVGVGTDVVQIDRIEKLFAKYGEAFLGKNFHSKEIECFRAFKNEKGIAYLAKRFAGKEAVAKAFGKGVGDGLAFKDIAILNDELGAPYVDFSTSAIQNFSDKKIHISLSDDYPIAVAFVVISQ
jgi:holo-[acyl-carrier protein] synthase